MSNQQHGVLVSNRDTCIVTASNESQHFYSLALHSQTVERVVASQVARALRCEK